MFTNRTPGYFATPVKSKAQAAATIAKSEASDMYSNSHSYYQQTQEICNEIQYYLNLIGYDEPQFSNINSSQVNLFKPQTENSTTTSDSDIIYVG